MNLKKISIAVTVASALNISNVHADSIDDQMRDAFNMLLNTTTPSAYNSARRGVISGGSLFIKTPTKTTQLMSMTAPSFSAGCGGIDIYGGSFSFINKDEFIQMFQAIGSNALGYGVKLAIQSACPSCEQIMTSLEKTAQAINSMNIDSCQAAQGLVNAGIDKATTGQADTEAKNFGVNSGQWEDMSEAWSWTSKSGESPTNAIKDSNPEVAADTITINAIWRAAKESGVQTAFGGDDKFLEMLMTMTGTIIVNNPSTEPESDPKPMVYAGHSIKLADLVEGGKVKVYKCDTMDAKGCLKLSAAPSKEIDLKKGLNGLVYESLLGSKGLIEAYKSDEEWNDEAKQVLRFSSVLGSICTREIYISSTKNTLDTTGKTIAQLCAKKLSVEVAHVQVTNYLQTTRSALEKLFVSAAQENAKIQAINMIDKTYAYYDAEFTRMGGYEGNTNIIQMIKEINSAPHSAANVTAGK